MRPKFILDTERLILREACIDDVDNLLLLFEHAEVMRFYPVKRGRVEAINWIQYSQSNYAKYGHSKWIVETKKSGEFVGYCGLLALVINGVEEIELGYMLKHSAWGHGYATEAAAACLRIAIDQFKYRRITSVIDAKNLSAQKVAGRLGMELEKTFHDKSGIERKLFVAIVE